MFIKHFEDKSGGPFGNGASHRQATGEITLIALLKGVASDPFYRQGEALSDGIIELKTGEKDDEIEQKFRTRLIRGKKFDSKWHTLKLQDNGEVTLE